MPLGALLGAGSTLLGGFLSNRANKKASRASLRASQPINVTGPFGSAIFGEQGLQGTLAPGFQSQLNQLLQAGNVNAGRIGAFDFDQSRSQELERLKAVALPEEERRRSQVMAEQARRGRLGFGVGQPRTGAMANPELGALAEAESLASLLRQQQAQGFATQEFGNLLGFQGSLQNQQMGLAGFPTQQAASLLGGQLQPAAAAFAGIPGTQQAQLYQGLFSEINRRLGKAFSQPPRGFPDFQSGPRRS